MLPSQSSLFDIPSDIIYLNTAYMSPLLNSVVKAIGQGSQLQANPWKIEISKFYQGVDQARVLFSKIINAESNTVAIIPSASYGIETAAKNLSCFAHENIVLLENQFPSNVYPWLRLAKEKEGTIRKVSNYQNNDLTASILETINDDTCIVALPNVLWTTGQSIDLLKIRQKCDLVNSALVLDLTQSAGAMSIDFKKIKPDFAVVANYKWMLGPYTTGFLYVDPKYHQGQGLEEVWIARQNSNNFKNLVNYTNQHQVGAVRFDMGERSNFSLLPGVITALEQLLNWEIAKIEKTLKNQNTYLAVKLNSIGLKVLEEKYRGPHFLSAELPNGSNPKLLSILESKGIYISQRSNSLRITPHLWNNCNELDHFVSELSQII